MSKKIDWTSEPSLTGSIAVVALPSAPVCAFQGCSSQHGSRRNHFRIGQPFETDGSGRRAADAKAADKHSAKGRPFMMRGYALTSICALELR
jgi:hypothetical protein